MNCKKVDHFLKRARMVHFYLIRIAYEWHFAIRLVLEYQFLFYYNKIIFFADEKW